MNRTERDGTGPGADTARPGAERRRPDMPETSATHHAERILGFQYRYGRQTMKGKNGRPGGEAKA